MLNIDKQVFGDNLRLTQAYCDLQLRSDTKDNAKVFRSYNPLYGERNIFSFETEHYDFEIEPNVKHCTRTQWLIDPTDSESIMEDLFTQQITHKKQSISSVETDKTYSGRVLISQIDCTVTDGASEVQSLGLIDIYDIPPIDTWLYMVRTKESRLLFSWIPNELVYYANDAIEVNCVDCINWADIWYPQEFKPHFGNDKDLLEKWQSPNTGIVISGAEKKMSFWSQIKRLFEV